MKLKTNKTNNKYFFLFLFVFNQAARVNDGSIYTGFYYICHFAWSYLQGVVNFPNFIFIFNRLLYLMSKLNRAYIVYIPIKYWLREETALLREFPPKHYVTHTLGLSPTDLFHIHSLGFCPTVLFPIHFLGLSSVFMVDKIMC